MPQYVVDPIVKHRRELRRQILLPVLGPLVLIFTVMVLLFGLTITGAMEMGQLRIITDIMLVVCFLCPLAITMIIIDVIFIGMVWGTAKLPTPIKGTVRSVRGLTERVADSMEKLSKLVAQPFINLESRFTRWGTFMARLFGIKRESTDQTNPTHQPKE